MPDVEASEPLASRRGRTESEVRRMQLAVRVHLLGSRLLNVLTSVDHLLVGAPESAPTFSPQDLQPATPRCAGSGYVGRPADPLIALTLE